MAELSPSDPDLLSVPETARLLGIESAALEVECRCGRFPAAVQIAEAHWLVSAHRLERWLHGEGA